MLLTMVTEQCPFKLRTEHLCTIHCHHDRIVLRPQRTSEEQHDCHTKQLLSCIDRVSLIVSEKLKSPLRCVIGDGEIDITTKTAIGTAHDCCPVEGSGGGLEIGFNNKYMMDALKAAPMDQVTLELSSPITPCIIVPAEGEENFLFMVLPVRLKADY